MEEFDLSSKQGCGLVSESKVQDSKEIIEQIKNSGVASIMFIMKYIVLEVNMIPLFTEALSGHCITVNPVEVFFTNAPS